MKRGETSSKKKVERKTVEKNRRILMNLLCFKLVSLIPNNYFAQPKLQNKRSEEAFALVQEFLSQQDQLDHSVAYIEILRERVEELRRRKTQLTNTDTIMNYGTNNMVESRLQPILTVKELGSDVEVVLISGLNKNFRVHDVITIIEQEAAEVFTVSISTIDGKIIHTIYAQVKISRVGVDTARISERIQELIASTI